MKDRSLEAQYMMLTAEERFRLAMAALGRDDEAECDRLARTGSLITLTTWEYVPYKAAFDELKLLVYIRLLEDASYFQQTFFLSREAVADDSRGAAALRLCETALAAAYILRSGVDAWRIFCERLGVPPYFAWEWLPGHERLQHALAQAEKQSFTPDEFVRWLDEVKPAGWPEIRFDPCDPDKAADWYQKLFDDLLEIQGGRPI